MGQLQKDDCCENVEEGCDPMAYLPEEIWETVFGYLHDSPKTLLSCCRASETWDNMLSVKKSTWLFEEIFPFIFPYLKNQDILKCRLVCQSWRNAVDHAIEDHPCHHPSTSDDCDDGDNGRESVDYPLISKQLHQIRFNDVEELTKFRLEMEHTSRNPIIGRSVCFYARPYEEWMMTALHFLSEFGRHIWYFSFQSLHTPTQFLPWLRQCLVLLPNLKKLHACYAQALPVLTENETQQLVSEITEEIHSNTLPRLPFLETLEIITFKLPTIVQDTIISTYARQLLRLETIAWNPVYINQENYCLSNLKELNLKVDSHDVLTSLTKLHCPNLRKLTLYFIMANIDLQCFSRLLYHFRADLRVLKITLTGLSSFKMDGFSKVFADFVLPKLKVLVLVNADELPYHFLRCLQSVEYLHFEKWRREYRGSTDPLSFVQIKGYIPFTMKQDTKVWIWDIIPTLKRLTYHDIGDGKGKQIFYPRILCS